MADHMMMGLEEFDDMSDVEMTGLQIRDSEDWEEEEYFSDRALHPEPDSPRTPDSFFKPGVWVPPNGSFNRYSDLVEHFKQNELLLKHFTTAFRKSRLVCDAIC